MEPRNHAQRQHPTNIDLIKVDIVGTFYLEPDMARLSA